MKINIEQPIAAPPEAIWAVITDIENAAERISAIQKIEVLERPESGLIGLKWKETRTLFGKTATETMWITEAESNVYYCTRAESHGVVYRSELRITEVDGACILSMSFEGQPQTRMARVMSCLMGWMFKGATEKAVRQDLENIRVAVESRT